MQMAAIEFARNVCGLTSANSTEFVANCPQPVIHLMEEQRSISAKGGTMRLGACPCTISAGTRAYEAYGDTDISERHRHRYEFNNQYREQLTSNGLVLSGLNQELDLVEIIELPNHPWFLACQFHPEFKSKPLYPHPLFKAFIKGALSERSRD